MKKLLPLITLAAAFAAFSSLAYAQSLQVVNAASLTPNGSVAPGSIVTIFGLQLTTGTARVADAANPPETLGGVMVTVGGVKATLFYVSPTQVNAVLGRTTPLGSQTLTLTSSTGTKTGPVQVEKSPAPGIFSLSGSGTRDGAILNAITYGLGSFSTTTLNRSTFLSIFATGIDASTTPVVTIGGVPVTVLFAGDAPCCAGLQQVNVQIPDALAGAGRVPVIIRSGEKSSNIVEVVLLPNKGQGAFQDDEDNESRNREIAGLAWVPTTSLAVVTDENDDVVRVVDLVQRKVIKTIALPNGAEPVAIAVNSTGKFAVVAERDLGKAAIIDLTTYMVVAQVPVGSGPVAVAISNNLAAVLNGETDNVSVIDLTTRAVVRTIATGHAPRGIAVDTATSRAYITNENAGSVSVVDLNTGALVRTYDLGASTRPQSIVVVSSLLALITEPASGPDGRVILLNLTTGATTSVAANPERSGGSNDIAIAGNNVFIANQTGGSVSLLQLAAGATTFTGSPVLIRAETGVRALAIDTKDNWLIVTNQGTGNIVLIDLTTRQVVGRIDAVRGEMEDKNGKDDRGDRDRAANLPTLSSLSPGTGKIDTTFTLTLQGTNLTGA
ncbi:MAG TPA: hypothetical protein VMZ52_16840, partial [Bryobacteraceae bacterium]|nr:hypothetical protein [Bryobacteraceae bacterium]